LVGGIYNPAMCAIRIRQKTEAEIKVVNMTKQKNEDQENKEKRMKEKQITVYYEIKI
jgi:hypothetical protein